MSCQTFRWERDGLLSTLSKIVPAGHAAPSNCQASVLHHDLISGIKHKMIQNKTGQHMNKIVEIHGRNMVRVYKFIIVTLFREKPQLYELKAYHTNAAELHDFPFTIQH